jgi:hypothetical protein
VLPRLVAPQGHDCGRVAGVCGTENERENDTMRLLLCTLAAAALLSAAPVSADPASCGFSDPRLCDPSKVYYCPDTGQMATWLAPCPSLIQGPYLPGGRTPDGGLAQ